MARYFTQPPQFQSIVLFFRHTIFGIRGTFSGWVDESTNWVNFTSQRLDAEPYHDPAIFIWCNGIPSTRGWSFIEININATMATRVSVNVDPTDVDYDRAKINLYFSNKLYMNTISQNPKLIADGRGGHLSKTYDFWNSGNGHANGTTSAIDWGKYSEIEYGVRWEPSGITLAESTLTFLSFTPTGTYPNDGTRWIATYDLYFKDSLSGTLLEWSDSNNPRQILTWIMNYIGQLNRDGIPKLNVARFRFTK